MNAKHVSGATDGVFEGQFTPQQVLNLKPLNRGTLWLSTVPGVAVTAVPIIRLLSTLIGTLVRLDV
jgi:hypothetical protein